MFDCHSHTIYSMDSGMTLQDSIQSAISKGIQHLYFTDHIDLFAELNGNSNTFALDSYFLEIEALKELYQGQIKLYAGVEIGLQPGLHRVNDALASSYPFDFVIGSIHTVSFRDIFLDQIFAVYSINEVYERYFNEMLECVQLTDDFDVLGHMDYIDRYAPHPLAEGFFDPYQDKIEAILSTLIQKGKGLEVNTAGLRKSIAHYNPKNRILETYQRLGGHILTIGSDGHRPEDVGEGCFQAISHVKRMGFDSVSIYEKRERKAIRL